MSENPETLGFESLEKEMLALTEAHTKALEKQEQHYKDLNNHFDGVKKENAELAAKVEEKSKEYADITAEVAETKSALDMVKKQLDDPIMKGGSELKEHDRKQAIELQKRLYEYKKGSAEGFELDEDNLVNLSDYRSAAEKIVKHTGLETKANIMRSLTEGERKAMDAGSMDSALFVPQMLGIELDCNPECAYLLDLYGSVNVSKSTFMYPHVVDYGAIGQYDCPAKCDAELGPEGNITYKNGKTHDFRGVFCFQRETLAEANYDLLGFMVRAAERSHRINRNQSLITGDGVNTPKGWLTADCFAKRETSEAGKLNHVDARMFVLSAPTFEYGPHRSIMHQNVLAWLGTQVDNNGRFIFGDGAMDLSPDGLLDAIRISNCLPDPTEDLTLGDDANPMASGDFIMAHANWDMAYKSVTKRPMVMQQYEGGSSLWCVQYQFWAQDGGFVHCCDAGRTLVVK